ncbi:hypothetical protein SLS53_003069 [Cytospora paraplurivora]|uniref:Uncharacterized protein n=1 Tax=Cytospora paraplurivora TaxID=2898453 RepID=A0AAN9UC75_9PEZI
MLGGAAVQNILYSSNSNPIKLTDNEDMEFIKNNVLCEGEVEFELSGGEKRILQPGDVAINRASLHKWRNTSTVKPARMLYVLLDVEPVIVNGQPLDFQLGLLQDEYAKYKDGEGYNKNE